MLTLNDGRIELYQWDTGRKLSVAVECTQVHYSNKVFGRSIDVDVVDGVAIIPDILLQTDKELTAWAFVGTPENGYTKISKTFKVNRRNKPADYVFTPPEQTTLGELVERLQKIEETQGPDVIENAVKNYLDANPVRPGATTEQAAQIEQNKKDIADLQTEVDELKESGGNGSGQNPGIHIGPEPPTDSSMLWVDTDDETEDPDPLENYYTKAQTHTAIRQYVDAALGVIENGAY